MRQRAVVLETKGNIAVIEVSRSTMCDGCEKNSGCAGHCDITGIMSAGNKMKAKAENVIGAAVGETVEIETESSRVLGYAALVFLVPIVMCAVFYQIVLSLFHDQAAAVGGAAAGFVLTFALIAIIDRKIAKRTPDIKIVGRITE